MISLAEKCPDLIPEWDESNGKLTPWDISYGSNKKAAWKGACGHTWKALIKNRSNGSGCPYCSSRSLLRGFNDLATKCPWLVPEWSVKNGSLTPYDVTARSSSKNVWWKCSKCSHEWKARVADRADGHGCPVCSGEVIVEGINDLAMISPAVASEWSEKNKPLEPSKISPKSTQMVWWKCSVCGYEWRAVVNSRVKGQSCPACADRVVNPGFNDLATICPELAAEWDFEHNKGLTPDKILASSMRSVFWKDYYGHVWRAKISDRVAGAECPYCRADRNYVFKLRVIAYYAKLAGYTVYYMCDNVIGLPIEIYILEKKIAIEFCGSKFDSGEIWRKENAKNWLCIKAGIKLFRIIPPGEKGFDNCICISLPEDNIMNYEIAIKTVFKIAKIKADINVERDISAINDTEIIGGTDDEEPDDKSRITDTWHSTLARNMLPGV